MAVPMRSSMTPGQPGNGSDELDALGVAELIQRIQFGKKDGVIRVEHAGEQSQLWCAGGDVVDAKSARLTGAAAVYRILALEQGRVHADFAPVQHARAIFASTDALLLEAAKRVDECRVLRARLGDTSQVYVPSANAPPESEIEPDLAEVLAAFDGTRSVEQVVHDSEFPDLETLDGVARLLEQEWLAPRPLEQLREPRPRTAPREPEVEYSATPLAASLDPLRSAGLLHPQRPRLLASAVAGVFVVAAAFCVGFYSTGREPTVVAPPVLAAAPPPALVCASGMALLPGGQCLDENEVDVVGYGACVRASACESLLYEPVDSPTAPALTEGVALEGAAVEGAAVEGAAVEGAAAPSAPSAISAAATSDADPRSRCNAGVPGREKQPVNCVTIQQARQYCQWRGGRLPTRAEWELAASAGSGVVGVANLAGSLSEWTVENAPSASAGADGSRDRYVVLGGVDTGSGIGHSLTRLSKEASAQGRNVGFRCAAAPGATGAIEPSAPSVSVAVVPPVAAPLR